MTEGSTELITSYLDCLLQYQFVDDLFNFIIQLCVTYAVCLNILLLENTVLQISFLRFLVSDQREIYK